MICRLSLIAVLSVTMVAREARADWPTERGDYARTSRSSSLLDPTDLAKRWTSPEGYTSPILVNETVVAIRSPQSGSEPKLITGFDVQSGQQRWTAPEAMTIRAPSALDGLLYYFVQRPNDTYDFVVRDAVTGSVRLRQSMPGIASESPLALRRAPDGSVMGYLSGGSAAAFRINASGVSLEWVSTGGGFGFASGIKEVSPLTEDAIAHSDAIGAWVTRLSDGHSTELFRTGISSGAFPSVCAYDAPRRRLFVTDPYGTLHAYDYRSPTEVDEIWSKPYFGGTYSGTLGVAVAEDGSLYARNGNADALVQLDGATGATLQSLSVSLSAYGAPVIQGGYVWVGELSGPFGETRLTAFDLATLQRVASVQPQAWSYTAYGAGAFDDQHMVVTTYTSDFRRFDVYAVPEPSSAAVAGSALSTCVACRRSRRRASSS